jgi:hypothetical protein
VFNALLLSPELGRSVYHQRIHPISIQQDGRPTPGGEWKWRAIFERGDNQYEEVLVKQLIVNVPSFSREDEMPVVGRKYHMACHGVFRIEDGIGIIE